MNPLEIRKIVQVGYRFDRPETAPVLDARGLPVTAVETPYTVTIAFWIPAKKPYARCAGDSKVIDMYPHERQALKDGAIFEHVQDFTFPRQPSIEELRRAFMPVWEALTLDSLGYLPNAPPQDHSGKTSIQFTPIIIKP